MLKYLEESMSYPGDIVEIGAGAGTTTKILLEYGKKHGKKVIVIDPFDKKFMPDSYGTPYSNEEFMETVKGFDNLELYEVNSLSHKAWEVLEGRAICFAYIDGRWAILRQY